MTKKVVSFTKSYLYFFDHREDWKPVLTINAIVYGIQYLFLEPNPDDPLNKGITCLILKDF